MGIGEKVRRENMKLVISITKGLFALAWVKFLSGKITPFGPVP